MSKTVYIVEAKRTAIGKAHRGSFKNTRPDDLLAFCMKEVVAKTGVPADKIEDIIIGCAMPEGPQGLNVARISAKLAGFPDCVPAVTVNRFCSSGVESIAMMAQRIQSGSIDCGLAGGVESMSSVPMTGFKMSVNPAVFDTDENVALAYGMGLTAEAVAAQYKVTREQQDAFAVESHKRVTNAQKNNWLKNEILPYPVTVRKADLKTGYVTETTVMVDTDEGVRADSSVQGLSRLKSPFEAGGSVTAGNSSQMSDGAAVLMLASEDFVKENNLKPIAKYIGYHVAGVPAEIMGIGPIKAIPKVLSKTGLKLEDIGWIELNEAFAAQSVAIINTLGLDTKKVNPMGGAIATGHPLGATGAIRACSAIYGAKRIGEKYAMVTMCIGAGMGAAGVFEIL